MEKDLPWSEAEVNATLEMLIGDYDAYRVSPAFDPDSIECQRHAFAIACALELLEEVEPGPNAKI